MINEAQGVYDFKTEACRRFLWFYCRVKNPKFYSPERKHLKEFCEKLQEFTTSNKKAMNVIGLMLMTIKTDLKVSQKKI